MAKLIAIDAGHGMYTQGKQSVPMSSDLYINGKMVRVKGKVIKENEWNRGVATFLNDALVRCGFRTMYTSDMTGKTDVSLASRVSKANNAGADFFISCHYNAIGSCNTWQTKCKGLLVLKHNKCSNASSNLANVIHKHLVSDVDFEHDYGVGTDTQWSGFSLYVLKHTNMAANLIEYGFMDYEKEAKKMLDPSYQKKCAEATAKGICEYFGVKYKAPSTNESFLVKVITDELNIRSGPSTSYPVVGTVHKGDVYTIVKVSGSWGFLKSGKGWININSKYCTKV